MLTYPGAETTIPYVAHLAGPPVLLSLTSGGRTCTHNVGHAVPKAVANIPPDALRRPGPPPHLLAVAATVLEYGGSEEMAIAALVTFLLDETGSMESIKDDTIGGFNSYLQSRYIEHLKTVDRETCLVSLSDKVHNARSILRDLRKPEIGPAVWSRFGNRPKGDTLWYYRELASAFQDLLPGQLAEELMEIVIVLENE